MSNFNDNGVANGRLVDGSADWSAGVDSISIPTIASAIAPNGLKRNQLAWLVNASVRGGGITQMAGLNPIGAMFTASSLFQGKFMYEPIDDSSPYFVYAISGNIFKVTIDPFTITQINTAATGMPASQPYYYFCQAEQFLIIQAGDYKTLPLFWDGTVLRRSLGIISANNIPGGATPFNELPAAGPMDYYMGRVWYGQQRTYSAGDIVGDTASGTLAYNFNDAVLKVTENPLAFGGDGFSVPTQAGTIRAIKHNANLDSATGQGNLFIFTQRAVYSLQVPVNRTDWINATANNQPLQTVVQLVNGSVNDRAVVAANGDLFYQSLEPGIRSLISAIRYFNQWGNVEISANENRILSFVDRALLKFASGIVFDNRLLQTSLPKQLPQGVVHQALIPMDFIPISDFGANLFPVWEGMYEGFNHLQLATGNFGGLERAFTTIVAQDGTLQLWELSTQDRFNSANRADGGDRITWVIEFPSFNFDQPFEVKDLATMELWVDRLYGTVDYTVEFRPDGDPCWHFWTKFRLCSARNSCEDVSNPVCYPIAPYGENYKQTVMLPKPPLGCATASNRPLHRGYQFQVRFTIKGFCRVRGMLLIANPVEKATYDNLVCGLQFLAENQAFPQPAPSPPNPPPPPQPPPTQIIVVGDTAGNVIGDSSGAVLGG